MPAGKRVEPTDWDRLPVAVGRAWITPDGAVVVEKEVWQANKAISESTLPVKEHLDAAVEFDRHPIRAHRSPVATRLDPGGQPNRGEFRCSWPGRRGSPEPSVLVFPGICRPGGVPGLGRPVISRSVSRSPRAVSRFRLQDLSLCAFRSPPGGSATGPASCRPASRARCMRQDPHARERHRCPLG